MNEIYLWVGLVIVNLILGALWVVTGYLGKEVYDRIKRIYGITVVWYWLDRLEKEGLRTFEKARKEPLKETT